MITSARYWTENGRRCVRVTQNGRVVFEGEHDEWLRRRRAGVAVNRRRVAAIAAPTPKRRKIGTLED